MAPRRGSMCWGLSPRSRGKRRIRRRPDPSRGPIPAVAGETQCRTHHHHPRRAYPRGRGGNSGVESTSACTSGLSPRSRGKLEVTGALAIQLGPIPAVAGETSTRSMSRRSNRAYPRGRGGNRARCRPPLDGRGLSPRSRGKRIDLARVRLQKRPIPAVAGETSCRFSFWAIGRAYPRGRGGNCPAMNFAVSPKGLSPRSRGKRAERRAAVRSRGPIPAVAGETTCLQCQAHRTTAYPRGRGGNTNRAHIGRGLRGLSPRSRGKRSERRAAVRSRGPIPAVAGETLT